MTRAARRLPVLPILLLPALATAGPVHASIGVCTRKDDFAKRQAKLDPLVAELATAEVR